jgi:Trk K+ transport system NAD-binding subunit
MTTKPTLRKQFRYFFDNFMSRGTVALIGGLAIISLVVITIAATVVSLGGLRFAPAGASQGMPFYEAAWESLMRTFDAGTMGGDVGWGFRFVMFFVTLGGVFVVSTLIGVLTAGVEGKLDELRKGRSQVLESGHTLILGWSPQIFTILSELMIANENQKNARIVILADKDKVEMEDEVRTRVESTGSTKVICRSGSPIDLADLEIGSPHAAKSIIVLPPEEEDPDSYVIKTVLALVNNPNRRTDPYHIVTQIRGSKNMDVVKMVGAKDKVLVVLTGDLIARLVAQTSRQSGLSVVYTELMNYGGDEIYFKQEAALDGMTFGESLLQYEDSSIIGVRFANGSVSLNPSMDTRLAAGDKVIAISADDDTIRLSGLKAIPVDETAVVKTPEARKASPEKCLILGWNRSTATIIRELDNYVAKGSEITIVADPQASDETAASENEVKAIAGEMKNQKVVFSAGDTTDRALLEKLGPTDFDHVIALSYAGLEVQAADAKTLVTLLHLRDIANKDATPFSMVSEMLDLRNRELAEVAHVDDFIVSDHLVSLMMTQLSENAELFPVFTDMFDPEGSEIYLKPAGDYIQTGRAVNFYTVVESARRRGQVAIGYRLARESGQVGTAYGVHTNPKKSETVTFQPEDKIIVVAED